MRGFSKGTPNEKQNAWRNQPTLVEIEFIYNGKGYSITYYDDGREKSISVCEFYKTPIDVRSANDVLELKIGPYTLEQIFADLPESAFDIY